MDHRFILSLRRGLRFRALRLLAVVAVLCVALAAGFSLVAGADTGPGIYQRFPNRECQSTIRVWPIYDVGAADASRSRTYASRRMPGANDQSWSGARRNPSRSYSRASFSGDKHSDVSVRASEAGPACTSQSLRHPRDST